jgi:hypothetical protein
LESAADGLFSLQLVSKVYIFDPEAGAVMVHDIQTAVVLPQPEKIFKRHFKNTA